MSCADCLLWWVQVPDTAAFESGVAHTLPARDQIQSRAVLKYLLPEFEDHPLFFSRVSLSIFALKSFPLTSRFFSCAGTPNRSMRAGSSARTLPRHHPFSLQLEARDTPSRTFRRWACTWSTRWRTSSTPSLPRPGGGGRTVSTGSPEQSLRLERPESACSPALRVLQQLAAR